MLRFYFASLKTKKANVWIDKYVWWIFLSETVET